MIDVHITMLGSILLHVPINQGTYSSRADRKRFSCQVTTRKQQLKHKKNEKPKTRKFPQPELRFVASQQKTKPNGAEAQHSHHNTRQTPSPFFKLFCWLNTKSHQIILNQSKSPFFNHLSWLTHHFPSSFPAVIVAPWFAPGHGIGAFGLASQPGRRDAGETKKGDLSNIGGSQKMEFIGI